MPFAQLIAVNAGQIMEANNIHAFAAPYPQVRLPVPADGLLVDLVVDVLSNSLDALSFVQLLSDGTPALQVPVPPGYVGQLQHLLVLPVLRGQEISFQGDASGAGFGYMDFSASSGYVISPP